MNILILIIKYLTVFVTQFILIRSYIYLLPKKIKMTKQMVGIIVLSSLLSKYPFE